MAAVFLTARVTPEERQLAESVRAALGVRSINAMLRRLVAEEAMKLGIAAPPAGKIASPRRRS